MERANNDYGYVSAVFHINGSITSYDRFSLTYQGISGDIDNKLLAVIVSPEPIGGWIDESNEFDSNGNPLHIIETRPVNGTDYFEMTLSLENVPREILRGPDIYFAIRIHAASALDNEVTSFMIRDLVFYWEGCENHLTAGENYPAENIGVEQNGWIYFFETFAFQDVTLIFNVSKIHTDGSGYEILWRQSGDLQGVVGMYAGDFTFAVRGDWLYFLYEALFVDGSAEYSITRFNINNGTSELATDTETGGKILDTLSANESAIRLGFIDPRILAAPAVNNTPDTSDTSALSETPAAVANTNGETNPKAGNSLGFTVAVFVLASGALLITRSKK
jgi:hypothetical protein